MKKKVLFICTGNSCRSQMAEGWANYLLADEVEAFSAGIETHGLNRSAVQVMEEAGVDISHQRSQHVDDYFRESFDLVVTVCDHARESCPVFSHEARMLHKSFENPPDCEKEVAAQGGSSEEQLNCYRRVRDEIKEFILTLPVIFRS